MNKIKLNDFKIEELQVILTHLKLGLNHLRAALTPRQFQELESYGTISHQEKMAFKSNKLEKISYLVLVLNSVVTGIFGAWTGLVTAVEMDVSSNLIHAAGVALLGGGILSIIRTYSKMNEIRRKTSFQKLQTVESNLFELICHKQKERLSEYVKKLKERYWQITNKVLDNEPETFEKKGDFLSWFYLFHQAIHKRLSEFPKKPVFQQHKEEALQILKRTEDSFIQTAELVGKFGTSLNENKKNINPHDKPVLEILVDPSFTRLKEKVQKKAWYKQGFLEIAFELLPTMLGALASILMWCNSGLLTEMIDVETCAFYVPTRYTPYFKVGVSIFFTINFLIFYFYSTKKSYERKTNIDATAQKLLNQEATTVQLSECLNLIYFLDSHIEEIMRYFEYSTIYHRLFKQTTSDDIPFQKLVTHCINSSTLGLRQSSVVRRSQKR